MSGGIWLPGTSGRAAQPAPTLTVVQKATDPDTVQGWLASAHPGLAEMCDTAPGLAAVFADIIDGLQAFCEERQRDPASLSLSSRLDGACVMIDLGI